MDQLKEILRQAIKYRFWIAVGLSALLPLIAYFAGAGAVQAKATAEAAKIEGADKKVKAFTSPTVPTAKYKEVVSEKTDDLTKDVDETWKKLYTRQAPLLTWPDRVQERFTKWGRKWPDKETTDASAVQIAINDYVNVYPEFVTNVYKSFKPFNPEDGTGVVFAPPEVQLLRPSQFTIEAPPTLGKVWAAQERLWIQRTLLDVVAEVNKNAKDWDSAIVRQIVEMEVGNPQAQDQRSIANGETLEEAPEIKDPSKPEDPAATASAMPGGGSAAENMASFMGMKGGPMSGMMGGMGGGMAASTESVYYIKNDSTQFKILPVKMTVLVEQDKMQNFLVALENSPMTIQVMDFEMSRPEQRVVKPVQGTSMMGMGGYAGMMGMGGYEGGMPGMSGMGGMYSRMGGRGAGGGMMMPGMDGMMGPGGAGMGGMGMMGAGGAPAKTGIDKRATNLEKERTKRIEAAKKAGGTSLHDPYYNIVQVTIYGQARFFNPPTAETPAAPSQAEGAAPAEGETKAEAPKDEAPKADAPKADATKADAPKADAPDSGTPKADAPKSDAPKADAPKADAAKSDAPKADAPKAEAPKADTPKADAPKADAPAPK